jgi:predicted PhzF superfamily epimerase YddE/YHI9
MTRYYQFRVFTALDGSGGNPLAVFLEDAEIPVERRQVVAAALGLAETVFVDDADAGRIRIFTPAVELPFAGHPSVGTSWLLARLERPVAVLRPTAGEAATWHDGDVSWVRARPEWVYPVAFEQLATPAEVEALEIPSSGIESWYPWAWINERAGIIRSRFFVRELEMVEDEATGGAAVALGGRLGRPLDIHQGRGSLLHVRPGPDGAVELGGRCSGLEVRDHPRGG